MAFCKYCGKELVNGVCDCPAAVQTAAGVQATADIETMGVPSQEIPPEGTQQQFAQQGANPQFAAAQAKAGAFFARLWNMILMVLRQPVTAVDLALGGQKKKEGLTIGGIHLLLLLITLWIHLPIGDAFGLIDGNVRFGFGFTMIILIALTIIIKTVIVLIYQKTGKAGAIHPFSNLLSAFCLITVPGSALLVLAFLFGFFATSLSFVLYSICIFAWICYSMVVIQQATFKDANGKALGAIIVQTIAIVVVLLIASIVLKGAFENAMKSSIGNLFR